MKVMQALVLVDSTSSTTLNETGVNSRWGNSSDGRIQCDVVLEAFVEASSTSARTYVSQVKMKTVLMVFIFFQIMFMIQVK